MCHFPINLLKKYLNILTKNIFQFILNNKETFMKIMSFIVGFILIGGSAYCGGIGEMKLVNEQEISLENITDIAISYSSDEIILLKSSTGTLVIKEYMNRNNSDYYANITRSGNKLSVNRGERPIFSLGNNNLRTRIEIYIPVPLMQEISIRTNSGRITASDDYIFSSVTLQTSSGSISVNTITAMIADITSSSGSIHCERINGNTNIKASSGSIRLDNIEGDVSIETNSGSIRFERINGNVSAKTTSGSIRFNGITGRIEAETSSGRINCSVNEVVGDISLRTNSGGVELIIPQNSIFNFSTKTSSGRLSTPFSDKLFMPVSERNVTQGIIGEGTPNININIRTNSGSINIKWGI